MNRLSQGAPEQVQEAIRRLREAVDPDQQRGAIEELIETDTAEVRDALVTALSQTRPGGGYGYNVASLIRVLGEWKEPQAIQPILATLHGPLNTREDHQIEVVAAKALSQLQANEALPILSKMLFDKRGAGIETELAEAIARIGGMVAELDLIKTLSAKRVEIAKAGARALCFLPSLSTEGLTGLNHAFQSNSGELKILAGLAKAATCPERAADIIEEVVASANDNLLRARLIMGLRTIGNVELSAQLLHFSADPNWAPARLALFALFADQLVPGADAVFEKGWRESETPCLGALAGAYLLRFRYESAVVDDLIVFVGRSATIDSRDTFGSQAMACEAIAEALTTHTASDLPRRLKWVLLLDDARKKKIAAHPRMSVIAGDHIERIVGTRMYQDFDTWVLNAGAPAESRN